MKAVKACQGGPTNVDRKITVKDMHKGPMFIGPIGTLVSAIQYFRRIGLPCPIVLKCLLWKPVTNAMGLCYQNGRWIWTPDWRSPCLPVWIVVVGKQRIRNLGRSRLDINPQSYRSNSKPPLLWAEDCEVACKHLPGQCERTASVLSDKLWANIRVFAEMQSVA